jgi:LysR family transcriptional regulator, cys regulon transcriptional activator
MTLQQLRVLRAVVKAQYSLTRAALDLGSSQPALSRAVAELETELGVTVFQRHGKRLLGLTDPGKAILARADQALTHIDSIASISADFQARDAGVLRIATTHTQARYALPPTVRAFRQRYPAVRLNLVQGSPRQIMQLLHDREVDLAIATEIDLEDPSLMVVPAFDWEHVVVVPDDHPLANQPSKNQVSLPELVKYPLVTYMEEFTGRRRIDAAFARAGLHPDVVLAAIDSDVIKTYVALGLGVGIMAGLAYDVQRDKGLIARPAGHLFGANCTRVAVRSDSFLRGFALAFIELFAPQADLTRVRQLGR